MTSALDMYWFHEAAEQAAREAGWRLLTGPTFMDVPDPPDGIAYAERLGWAAADLAGPRRRPPGTRPVLFAHSAYTLSPEQLIDDRRPGAGVRRAAAHPRRGERDRGGDRRGAARQAAGGAARLARGCSAPTCCSRTPWTSPAPEIAALARTGTSRRPLPGVQPEAGLRHRAGAPAARARG